MTPPTPTASSIPAPSFADGEGLPWHPVLGPDEVRDIRDGAPAEWRPTVDLARLADEPAGLFELLDDRLCLLSITATSCRVEARGRGIDFNGFVDRLLGPMADPAQTAALRRCVLLAVARAFPESLVGAVAAEADRRRRRRTLHPGAVRPFITR